MKMPPRGCHELPPTPSPEAGHVSRGEMPQNGGTLSRTYPHKLGLSTRAESVPAQLNRLKILTPNEINKLTRIEDRPSLVSHTRQPPPSASDLKAESIIVACAEQKSSSLRKFPGTKKSEKGNKATRTFARKQVRFGPAVVAGPLSPPGQSTASAIKTGQRGIIHKADKSTRKEPEDKLKPFRRSRLIFHPWLNWLARALEKYFFVVIGSQQACRTVSYIKGMLPPIARSSRILFHFATDKTVQPNEIRNRILQNEEVVALDVEVIVVLMGLHEDTIMPTAPPTDDRHLQLTEPRPTDRHLNNVTRAYQEVVSALSDVVHAFFYVDPLPRYGGSACCPDNAHFCPTAYVQSLRTINARMRVAASQMANFNVMPYAHWLRCLLGDIRLDSFKLLYGEAAFNEILQIVTCNAEVIHHVARSADSTQAIPLGVPPSMVPIVVGEDRLTYTVNAMDGTANVLFSWINSLHGMY